MSAQEQNDKSHIYKEMRSMPEFSVIISFLEAFGERIGIRNVTAEDLENALINSENSTLVYTVHKCLLKELGKKIGPDNWQRYVRREFIRRKELNDILGDYPFTDDEQVIAEDLANQPLFKKRKLDHIPSEDTENPSNPSNNNNNVKKEKKKDKKRDSDVKEEPKEEKVDLVENKNEQKSDNSTEVKKDIENKEDNNKEDKLKEEKKEESLSKSGSNDEQHENRKDRMEDEEDSEDQEFNADVSPEELQKLQNEDDEEMDAEDKYVDDEEELNARRSSRLSSKFLPAEEDLDLVRRSSRLSKRKREDEEDKENGNNNENGSDDNSGDEGSDQEPTAAKKMINTYYHPLSPKTKVIILRNLCEWILDRPTDRVQKEAKTLQDTDMQRLRPDPIHIDHKKGDNYWFFGKVSEERIFKEHVEEHEYKFKTSAELLKKDGESATIEWNTLTTSLSEVQAFFKSLENDSKTKELREFINEDILPPLITKQRKKDQAARRAASMDTLGMNRGNIIRETRTRRRAVMDSKCIYDIDTVLDWDNLK